MSNFANRTMGVSRKGTADGATPAVGDGSPPERLGSGQLFQSLELGALVRRGCCPRLLHTGPRKVQRSFQFAARLFRSTSLGGAMLSLRVSGIPCSSRSRVFVISARPNWAGAKAPALLSTLPITEHKP
jgi:hypothetical protein